MQGVSLTEIKYFEQGQIASWLAEESLELLEVFYLSVKSSFHDALFFLFLNQKREQLPESLLTLDQGFSTAAPFTF